MAVIKVQRRPLTLAERSYLPGILTGMMITIRHFFGPADTLRYPEERPAIPPGYRGAPGPGRRGAGPLLPGSGSRRGFSGSRAG